VGCQDEAQRLDQGSQRVSLVDGREGVVHASENVGQGSSGKPYEVHRLQLEGLGD